MLTLTANHPLWQRAEKHYKVGRRAYHTFQHALDVLHRVEQVDRDLGFVHYDEARVAALYHDAVYVPGASYYNEMNSADLFKKDVIETETPFDSVFVGRVEQLIINTAHHMGDLNLMYGWDTVLFLDCDMLGFAETPAKFKQQNFDIEFEDDPTDKTAYAAKRLAFFTKLYKRGVFRSPYIKRHYEERALSNLKTAIEELRGIV